MFITQKSPKSKKLLTRSLIKTFRQQLLGEMIYPIKIIQKKQHSWHVWTTTGAVPVSKLRTFRTQITSQKLLFASPLQKNQPKLPETLERSRRDDSIVLALLLFFEKQDCGSGVKTWDFPIPKPLTKNGHSDIVFRNA